MGVNKLAKIILDSVMFIPKFLLYFVENNYKKIYTTFVELNLIDSTRITHATKIKLSLISRV